MATRIATLLLASLALAWGAQASDFRSDVKPLLEQYCYDCHGDGMEKGGVSLDQAAADNHDVWLKALKNVRAGIMPPPKKPQPSATEKLQLENWIKSAVLKADAANPDPGRVTVRRLNRAEYRNTIRDLLGIDFDTEKEFPPDDSGHGFDNISDALTLPPMLLEKYLAAARTIVSRAVPDKSFVPAEKMIAGRSFSSTEKLSLSYYQAGAISNSFNAQHAGKYQVVLDFVAAERFVDNQFDLNKCRLTFKVDGEEVLKKEYTREGNRAFRYEFDRDWQAGEHSYVMEVEPLTPNEKQIRSLNLRLEGLTVRGPFDPKHSVRPKNYERFFGEPPNEKNRHERARDILEMFVTKAYRRPVSKQTVDRLVALAESIYNLKGKTFEQGVGQAMVAVLASPRFLFREEGIANQNGKGHPNVDEYALASRLSYFLWSSMPDDELIRLAGDGKLRANLAAQSKRMLADTKSESFFRNFVGQWLQTRDIETVQIDARQVLNRERESSPPDRDFERRSQRMRELRDREDKLTPEEKAELATLRGNRPRGFGRGPRVELTGDLRRAMRQETEKTVEYVIREDRPLRELIDGDYTFLNERLALHYGITNVTVTSGEKMQLVKLPGDSPRGGVLTHGSVLAVTSNPTRTSPVKRGLFILDNLLGTPPPPPPPDIPPLEDAAKAMKEKTLSLRETLALHREQALCASCHNRMDPLGLALENFNAMGMWREKEQNLPIDAAGKLMSGEAFTNIRELKQILATNHETEFYRTVTEKLLTYALGRGLEYYDEITVDAIVDDLKKSGGKPSALLAGVINSAPFQKTRKP